MGRQALAGLVSLFVLSACAAAPGDERLEAVRQRSTCGATADYQHVARYDGSLGPSVDFVTRKQQPVAQLRYRPGLAYDYTNPGNIQNFACSGTMIAPDLFLTAGHCVVPYGGWEFPLHNGTTTPLSSEEAAHEMQVVFNYQVDFYGEMPIYTATYDVIDLVELKFQDPEWVDFAILRIGGSPGNTFGTTPINTTTPPVGEPLTIIGHPDLNIGISDEGLKVVSAGPMTSSADNRLFYAVDTAGGSSGSGVLDHTGAIVAVHANPGCGGSAAANSGTRMDVIYAQSPTIRALARDDFAFAWAQNLTGTFNAQAAYSLNSSGPVANVISQVSTGKYAVTFPSLANLYGGNVLVTAHGQGSERCDVEGPGTDFNGNRTVNIECYNASGTLANTRFAVSYTRNGIASGDGRGAYLWSRPTGPTHSWNSSGGINQVQKTATGVYLVTFPGQAPAPRGGTVQATAFKSSGHCKVGSWAPSGSSMNAVVRCYSASGAPADSEFMVFYSPERTSGAPSGGYAWANNPTASSYSPHDAYEYIEVAPNGAAATHVAATRSSVGVYALEYPGLAATGSNALITAYGSNANYCKIASWNGTASLTTVNVRCFNPAGAAVDTQFVSNYATSQQ